MKQETLARAKELEEDIRDIRMAMTESSNSRHFAMLQNYGYDANRYNLPRWLTPKIMMVLGEERERLEHELENLTDENSDVQTDFEPTGKYNVEPKADDVEPLQKPKRMGFWKFLFVIVFIGLAIICGIEFVAIRNYQKSEAEWEQFETLWREKLDTCINRNERIYNQLNEFYDIRIKQLKEKIKEE